jgi:sodium transport system permease protein
MRLKTVGTIFRREVRDQVRDRRTLFMVFALPILLYPVLGIGVVQFTMAFQDKPREVVVVGAEYLPPSPPLLSERRDAFHPDLVRDLGFTGTLRVRCEPPDSPWANKEFSRIGIRQGQADAVMMIPPDVATRLEKERSANVPIEYVSADERSQLTYLRVREILTRWNEKIVEGRLAKEHKTSEYVDAVRMAGTDLATKAEAGVNVWAKIFPFLLVIMALTGAFYPSIDLCAGEKERGTMETLLISPASRGEIVMGKFLTVVLASMTTAILNLLSMALTGLQLAYKLAGGSGVSAANFGPPTLMAAFWMIVLLVPLSVFFSAICVALAVLAKSMKEGQYYMTPLYMVSLPLILLTLAPGVELTPFYSMVPITGVGLLLKSLILGDYGSARRYFIPVLVPMVIYAAVALRWAVDQFRREDVLFRESERFDVIAWLRHLVRHRQPTPTPSQAFFCFTLMICLAWFATQALGDIGSPLVGVGLGHLLFILLPPVMMTVLFTSEPKRTLRLSWPDWRYVGLGLGLALALNPFVREFSVWADWLFPPPRQVTEHVEALMRSIPNVWIGLLVFAVIPSITEEVAFRGYILSGLERGHRTRTAILISAFLFGFLHVLISLFNQLFTATLLGVVLGLLAVRSRSLLPGIVFHLVNNGLGVVLAFWTASTSGSAVARWLFRDVEHGLYRTPILVAAGLVSAVLLVRLYRGIRSSSKPSVESDFAPIGSPKIESRDVARV